MPPPNRAQRRDAVREWRHEHGIRGLEKRSDPRRPLEWRDGYEHVGCGGDAERANNPGVGAYCHQCGHTVPNAEVRRR